MFGKINKVFLGGTWNGSTWREELIPYLEIQYFNPIVDDWTPECQKQEEWQKEKECNIHLYHINDRMTGVFSIAEAVESTMNPYVEHTYFSIDPFGFTEGQLKSLRAVKDLVARHGAFICEGFTMKQLAMRLNAFNEEVA